MIDKPKHTPGPWSSHIDRSTVGMVNACIAIDSEFGAVAIAHGQDEEAAANGRLIAAAPSLRQALLNLLRVLTEGAMFRGNPYACLEVKNAILVLTDGKSKYDLPKE